ncbi:unnamed protein product [Caenorhabditis sp. 36 PRJEB53466]|nr:unnamed protein product [Caenorhabditis sp. 36 PRJEB53466]
MADFGVFINDEEDSRDSGVSTSGSTCAAETDGATSEKRCSSLTALSNSAVNCLANGRRQRGFEEEREAELVELVWKKAPESGSPARNEVTYSLPSVADPKKVSLAYRSISPQTILSEMRRLGAAFSDRYALYDCRYPYEYAGGHLRGAVNLYKKSDIRMEFFDAQKPKRIPIFYCEFSQKRGPSMANAVRSIDRVRNEHNYPHLEHPEMYLLDRGYKNLWDQPECREICAEPIGYLPMAHEDHTEEYRTARLERHRSSEMVKSNGEVEEQEETDEKLMRIQAKKTLCRAFKSEQF